VYKLLNEHYNISVRSNISCVLLLCDILLIIILQSNQIEFNDFTCYIVINVWIEMKTIHIFSEQLSDPVTHNDQNLDENGDREETLVEPVDVPIMLNASGYISTEVPSGRKCLFKRFRRWTEKRLRTLCCVWPQRDRFSCQKDACCVEIVGKFIIQLG